MDPQQASQVEMSVTEEFDEDGVLRSYSDPTGQAFVDSDAEASIRRFLDDRRAQLKLADVELEEELSVEVGGILRIRFQQHLHGTVVVGAVLDVSASVARGGVVSVDNALDYDVDDVPRPDAAKSEDDLLPPILRLFSAFGVLEATGKLSYLRYTERPPLPESDLPTATRDFLRTGAEPDGHMHLVRDFTVETKEPSEDFQVIVDATSGEVLYLKALSERVRADFLVYLPDPVTESGDATLDMNSTNAALNPFLHPVKAEISSASGGPYELKGDLVECRGNLDPPDTNPPSNNAAAEFKFDATAPEFLYANAYYWLDSIARYFALAGVPVATVHVDPQASETRFRGSTYPVEIHCEEVDVADAADMSVMIHEYVHAVYQWLGRDHGGSSSGYEHSVCDAVPAIFRDRFNVNPAGYGRTDTFPWDNNVNDQWDAERSLDRGEKFNAGYAYGLVLRNSMLATAFWDAYIGIGGSSASAEVRAVAGDELVETLLGMIQITTDADSDDPVKIAKNCINADMARTGGLYGKVLNDAFVERGLWLPPAIDLMIRDHPKDRGWHPSTQLRLQSPDIWVRNNPSHPELGHQRPIAGQTNYVYVRVHNRGVRAAPQSAFDVAVARSDSVTGRIHSKDFQLVGTLEIKTPVAAGGWVRVGPLPWTPTTVGKTRLSAVVHGAPDPAIPMTLIRPVRHNRLVRLDNNVAKRDVMVQ
jgi:hypothetical protein